jgi:hypothetical protein
VVRFAAVCLVTLFYPLHGDVRHEIGVQAVSGHSAASTFSHRPLLYRLIVSVLAWPADLVTTSTLLNWSYVSRPLG